MATTVRNKDYYCLVGLPSVLLLLLFSRTQIGKWMCSIYINKELWPLLDGSF